MSNVYVHFSQISFFARYSVVNFRLESHSLRFREVILLNILLIQVRLGGFILEGDWTPTKTKLLHLTTYRGGSLIFFQDQKPPPDPPWEVPEELVWVELPPESSSR